MTSTLTASLLTLSEPLYGLAGRVVTAREAGRPDSSLWLLSGNDLIELQPEAEDVLTYFALAPTASEVVAQLSAWDATPEDLRGFLDAGVIWRLDPGVDADQGVILEHVGGWKFVILAAPHEVQPDKSRVILVNGTDQIEVSASTGLLGGLGAEGVSLDLAVAAVAQVTGGAPLDIWTHFATDGWALLRAGAAYLLPNGV